MARVRMLPAERRAEIVGKAIKSLGSLGFNGLSLGNLARTCSISKAGLLHYFHSKEGVLIAVLDEIERRELELIGSAVLAATNERQQPARSLALDKLLRAIIKTYQEQPELARFITMLQAESLDINHPAYDWFKARETSSLQLFGDLLDGYHPDPGSGARQLQALMQGLAQQWLRSPSKCNLLSEWEKAVEIVLAAENWRPDPSRKPWALHSSVVTEVEEARHESSRTRAIRGSDEP